MPVTHDIILHAMQFQALVGILPHERATPQPIEVDLAVSVGEGPGIVDYRQLYDAVASIVGADHIDYLEEIADRIAASAFASSDRVYRARVAVRKPQVVLGGPLAYAEVRVERSRSTAGD